MTSSLQKQLNFFIYNTMAEDGLIPLIKEQIPIRQLEKSPLLLDQRWQTHLSEKEQGRINAYRYAQGFKIAQTTSDPNKIYQSLDYTITTLGLTLNTNAFLVSTDLLGDEEQTKYWRNQVYSGKVIGAYGQTELGHGSNVKDLETVAVYHEDKQKFIINSPSETSAKYWPGILGHFATHSVIQAKTIVKGKSIGVQTFVVQLRNQRLQPLKNVECFDIGPKLGFEKVDNGACLFKNVELPREAMLMRYVKVLPDGTVEGLENTQAIKYGYGSMLNLRVKLTYSFALGAIIHPACNLYQVLNKLGQADSPISRKKLTDFACVGYGIVISNRNTHNIFNSLMEQIKNKNFVKADKLLINCHIISSTHKAVSSRIGMDIAGELLTYNSQGKFKSSFLPYSYVSMTPSTTYEGDNTVLLQQTSKYLLFKFDTEKDFSSISRNINSNDWENSSKAIEYIVAQKLKGIKARIEQYGEKGIAFKTVWNEKEQVSLVQVSTLWGYMMFLRGLAVILPTITQNREFYTKICASFTSYLVEKVTELEVYGFTVKRIPTWQAFTPEEYQALLNINAPVERTIEPMRFYPRDREGDWLSAKL